MQSISFIQIFYSGLFGLVLGGFYFGLLWLTVKYLAKIRWPATWVLLSLIIRMGGLLLGLFWISAGSWERMLAALVGIIIVRVLFTRYVRPDGTEVKRAGLGKG